jgi:hypothetical protein
MQQKETNQRSSGGTENSPLLGRSRSRDVVEGDHNDEIWAHEHQMDSIGKVRDLQMTTLTLILTLFFPTPSH